MVVKCKGKVHLSTCTEGKGMQEASDVEIVGIFDGAGEANRFGCSRGGDVMMKFMKRCVEKGGAVERAV